MYLDLDDVVAGNPVAEQELLNLRFQHEQLVNVCKQAYEYLYTIEDDSRAQEVSEACRIALLAIEDAMRVVDS